MSDIDFSKIDAIIKRKKKVHTKKTSWTEEREVVLGKGNADAIVLIPIDERENTQVSLYCHDEVAETKGTYQVVNGGVGKTIPHENAMHGFRVKIGKPPGSNVYHIMGQSESGLAQTTAVPLEEIARTQDRAITPDRFPEVSLIPNGTLTPDFAGGKIRINGEWVPLVPSTGPDFTSHVPSTSNKERWVLVGVDRDGSFDLVDGADLDIGTSNPESNAPKISSAGFMPFEVVKLTNGDTEVKEGSGNRLPLAMIPAFTEAGITSLSLAGNTGTPEVLGDGNTITIQGVNGITTEVKPTDEVEVGLDIPSLTAETTPDNADYVILYDASATAHRKITRANFLSGLPAGTVTSVGLSMPSEFSVANSPVTGSAVLTVTKAVQNANKIYAGPGSGADAAPTFRVLVANDIPWASPNGIGTGTPNTGSFTALNTSGEVVFNDAGADVDFRVETDTDASALIVDGGTNSVAIGTTANAQFKLLVNNTFSTDPSPSINAGLRVTAFQTGAISSGNIQALSFLTDAKPGAAVIIAAAHGTVGVSRLNSAGTVTLATGVFAQAQQISTGTITAAYGIYGQVSNTSTGTITTGAALVAISANNSGGGTLTTAIGLDVQDQTAGGTANFAIRTGAGNIVFNENGDANTDVRMEGDTKANLFFLDASADSVSIDGTFQHKGSSLGFYNATTISKPTVTGSRGGNAALASLLTQLANLGLLTDSSS